MATWKVLVFVAALYAASYAGYSECQNPTIVPKITVIAPETRVPNNTPNNSPKRSRTESAMTSPRKRVRHK
jgi:hypothetical protein